jgi:hypothetical protein
MVIRWAGIYGENLNTQNPEFALLAQLLQIKGNDPLDIPSEENGEYRYSISEIIKGNINTFNSKIGAEIIDFYPFHSKLQLMMFLFEVGVAQ